MTEKDKLGISEVAKISGLPVSTLRFYEEKKLIQSIGRHGNRRLFSSYVLQQLNFVSLGRFAGFSLDEIAQMFNADGNYQIDREQLLVKAEELDHDIKQLKVVRDRLRKAAVCPAPNHQECPTFQKRLREARLKQVKARQKGKHSPLTRNKI